MQYAILQYNFFSTCLVAYKKIANFARKNTHIV